MRDQGIDIDTYMDQWAAQHVPALLDQLYDTTKADIVRVLSSAQESERIPALSALFAGYAAGRRPRISETEGNVLLNRVYIGAAAALGRDSKVWLTRQDERVRATHNALHGIRRGIDEVFESPSGDKAMAPGGFSTAAENVNCRCRLHTGADVSEEQAQKLLSDHSDSVDRAASRFALAIAPLFASMELLAMSAAARVAK